jgi:hypothetical protein
MPVLKLDFRNLPQNPIPRRLVLRTPPMDCRFPSAMLRVLFSRSTHVNRRHPMSYSYTTLQDPEDSIWEAEELY